MNDDDGEYDYDDGDKVEPITMNAIAYLVMFKEPKEKICMKQQQYSIKIC